ncbi:hypothetical protein FACS189454_07110 [Planctomycetales bacterium]|nr:hypothetical protein FACS189454_07110 [Planctomycetales bacterium]
MTGSRYLFGHGYISQSVRGAGNIDLELTNFGQQLFDRDKTLSSVRYSSGPVFYPAFREDLPDYVSLATFKTETWIYDCQNGEMIGKPSMIVAPYNQGQIFLISPHFEMSEGYENIIKKVIWSIRRND